MKTPKAKIISAAALAIASAPLLALLAAPATASPLSLDYSVTDLGGSYQYDFTLTVDNNDGSFAVGQGFDWFIIGDHPLGSTPIFPEQDAFFTALPSGWTAFDSSGGHNGPTLGAVDNSVGGTFWTPTLGESVSFSGVSTNLVADGALLWSNLLSSNGGQQADNLAATSAPVPLPASLPLLSVAVAAIGFGAKRRKVAKV